MPFSVFRVKGAAQLDAAPVAVVTHYPLERRDYKPYAQCNLCLEEESLLLRMWAFEVSPPEGSELRAVLYLFAERPELAFQAVITPQGGYRFSLREGDRETALEPPPSFHLHPHSGEDLQGVYWGGLAVLPLEWLRQVGKTALETGASFAGNFFKLCPGPVMAHQGSYFPADFTQNPFGREGMGEFTVRSC